MNGHRRNAIALTCKVLTLVENTQIVLRSYPGVPFPDQLAIYDITDLLDL